MAIVSPQVQTEKSAKTRAMLMPNCLSAYLSACEGYFYFPLGDDWRAASVETRDLESEAS